MSPALAQCGWRVTERPKEHQEKKVKREQNRWCRKPDQSEQDLVCKNLSYYQHAKVSIKLPETDLFLTLYSLAHCDSFGNFSDILNPYHESLTKPPPVLVLPCPEFQSSGIYAWFCCSHLQGVGSSENGTEMHRTVSSWWGRFFLPRTMSEREVTFLQFMIVSAKLLSTSSSRELKALGSAMLHLFYPVSSSCMS